MTTFFLHILLLDFDSDMHIIFKHDLSQLRGFNNVNFLQNPARHKTSPWLGHAPAIHSSWTGQMPRVHSVTPSQSQETLATPVPSRAPWTECRWTFPVARATVLECLGRMISVRASQVPPPSFQLVQLPHTYYSSPCTTQNVTDQANVFNSKMSVSQKKFVYIFSSMWYKWDYPYYFIAPIKETLLMLSRSPMCTNWCEHLHSMWEQHCLCQLDRQWWCSNLYCSCLGTDVRWHLHLHHQYNSMYLDWPVVWRDLYSTSHRKWLTVQQYP